MRIETDTYEASCRDGSRAERGMPARTKENQKGQPQWVAPTAHPIGSFSMRGSIVPRQARSNLICMTKLENVAHICRYCCLVRHMPAVTRSDGSCRAATAK
jgi:hypothetical protein